MTTSNNPQPLRISSQISGDPISPETNYYLNKAVKLIKELTKNEKNMKNSQSQIKIKTLIEINKNLELATKKFPRSVSIFTENKIIIYIKHFFNQNITKAPAIAFLRLIMVTQDTVDLYLKNNIPLFLAKIIERDQTKNKGIDLQEEIIEAIKFIAEWLDKYPSSFPKLLATVIVSFSELPVLSNFQQKKKDHIKPYLKMLSIDIILSLSYKNLQMCIETGGFTVLSNAITDPTLQERSHDIVCRLIYFLNEKHNRDIVSQYIDLKRIFSIFTDLDNVFTQQNSKSKGNMESSSRFQTQLQLAKNALITMLKSWTGIIYLGNEPTLIESLLEAFKQIPKKHDSEVRRSIYQVLDEIISVGDHLLSSNHHTQVEDENQFRISNLINCYMMTLIQLFIDRGLYKLLIELSGIDEPSIAEPAQRLLKKLSIYIFNFLPDSSKYIDFLILATSKEERSNNSNNSNNSKNGNSSSVSSSSSMLKYNSSFIINKIGNYIYDYHPKNKSPLLYELEVLFNMDAIFIPPYRNTVISISKSLNYLAYREIHNYRKTMLQSFPIPKEFKDNFKKWNWNTIVDLLCFPDMDKQLLRPDNDDKYNEAKLFKYLVKFYSFRRGNFSEQKWSIDNFIYLKAGKLLIQNAITIPDNLPFINKPPESQFQLTISFVHQLEQVLESTLLNFHKAKNKYYPNFFKTFERELVLWIGYLSQNKLGYDTLLCQNRFFEILYKYLEKKQCAYVIAGVMLHLDFFREPMLKKYKEASVQKTILIGPKIILSRSAKEGSKTLKLMCIEITKLLFKMELNNFFSEGFKILLTILIDGDEQLTNNAREAIEQLLKVTKNVEVLLSIFMEVEATNASKFHQIRNKCSSNIFIRISSLSEGFKFINQKLPNWLEEEYSRWVKLERTQDYFQNLELLLNNSLHFNKKQKEIGFRCEINRDTEDDFDNNQFIYKLPWLLLVNDEEQVPLEVKICENKIVLSHEFNNFNIFEEESKLEESCYSETIKNSFVENQLKLQNYDFLSNNPNNVMKLSLCIGNMNIDEEMNHIKQKHSIEINLNNNKLTNLFGQQYYCSNNNNCFVYFLVTNAGRDSKLQENSNREISESQIYATSYEVKRIQIHITLIGGNRNQQLPLHLIQEITKTQRGRQFLEAKEILNYAKDILQNKDSSVLELRSVLWSLGYYGSTKEGIVDLIKHGLIKKIVFISYSIEVLSLRGTCRYILNMFCHSEEGRNEIQSTKLYIINKKSFNCFPKDLKKFYLISPSLLKHFCLDSDSWNKYELKYMHPLENQNEKKIYESICLLVNSLSSKFAVAQIKELIKSNNRVIFSYKLLQNVVTLMSLFKFRYESRKTVHFIFQDFCKSAEFHMESNNKISYIMNADLQN